MRKLAQCGHLDYADDVALLAEMLEVLILSLENFMQEEASPFGLEFNWARLKSRQQLTLQFLSMFRWMAMP